MNSFSDLFNETNCSSQENTNLVDFSSDHSNSDTQSRSSSRKSSCTLKSRNFVPKKIFFKQRKIDKGTKGGLSKKSLFSTTQNSRLKKNVLVS